MCASRPCPVTHASGSGIVGEWVGGSLGLPRSDLLGWRMPRAPGTPGSTAPLPTPLRHSTWGEHRGPGGYAPRGLYVARDHPEAGKSAGAGTGPPGCFPPPGAPSFLSCSAWREGGGEHRSYSQGPLRPLGINGLPKFILIPHL